MKFLVDMGLSPDLVTSLQNAGYRATRANQLGMATATDENILNHAMKNNMVLVTVDLDFGNLLAYTQHNKPSVIMLRLKVPSAKRVNSVLTATLPGIEPFLLKGSLVVIDDKNVRIRELPISGTH